MIVSLLTWYCGRKFWKVDLARLVQEEGRCDRSVLQVEELEIIGSEMGFLSSRLYFRVQEFIF